MRAIIRNLSMLTLAVGLAGGLVGVGCSSSSDKGGESVNNVGLNLDVNGTHLNTLHVVVTNPNGFSKTFDLDVSGAAGNVLGIRLPVADGYSITVTTPDVADCGVTIASFNVVANATTNLTLSMRGAGCPGPVSTPTGSVTGTIDFQTACAGVYTYNGLDAFVGSKISVGAAAYGGGAGATTGVTFAWSGGTFTNATASDTTYVCESVGAHTISVTATGAGAYASCTASQSFTVNCVGSSASGGATGSGGASSGGAASGGAASGGAASGGAASGGAASGGAASGGETSSGGAASGGAASGGAASGGAASGGAASGGAASGGATSTTTPDALTGTSCETCEDGTSCKNFKPCDKFGAQVDSAGRLLADTCREVLACVVRTGCAGLGVEADCYCGSVSGPDCDAGLANGACKAEIERGLDTTNPAAIQSNFTKTTLGGGLALARVVCDNGSSCQSSCSMLSAND